MPRRLPPCWFTASVFITFRAAPALTAAFAGKVVGVVDDNTITVLHNGVRERIRLHGIDCPERHQAFGNRAKQFTSKLIFVKSVPRVGKRIRAL